MEKVIRFINKVIKISGNPMFIIC